MANTHIDHHLALLQHLRTILVALGEAEQILDDSHAMYLERYDELLSDLPSAIGQLLLLRADLAAEELALARSQWIRWLAAVLTVWSMVYYLRKAIPEIRAKAR